VKNIFAKYLKPFEQFPLTATRIEHVLESLPDDVKSDLLSDPFFRISLDDCEPGRGRTVVMAQLGPNGASRCVVLKPRLEKCSNEFSCYIIAHELAHAFLHNGGWGEITDREDAADALAASWGFHKVPFEWVD
jgi:hypothetical protein